MTYVRNNVRIGLRAPVGCSIRSDLFAAIRVNLVQMRLIRCDPLGVQPVEQQFDFAAEIPVVNLLFGKIGKRNDRRQQTEDERKKAYEKKNYFFSFVIFYLQISVKMQRFPTNSRSQIRFDR